MRSNRDEHGGAEWRPPTGRWQTEDGQAMLAALAASGQTPSAFARAKGFPPYRVSYWRAKFAAPERQEPQIRLGRGGFVPVAVRDAIQTQEAATERRVEVTLPNGRVVTFAGTWEAAAIAPCPDPEPDAEPYDFDRCQARGLTASRPRRTAPQWDFKTRYRGGLRS